MTVDAFWVRHGESTWNRAGVMQGQKPWPALTARGERQALSAAEELAPHRPTRVVSSDLNRAAHTARIIGTHLEVPVVLTPLLRERHWGVFEGRPTAEGERHEATLATDEPVPQGESRDDVADRIRRLFPSLSAMDGPVVVVTHGDVIREALRLWAVDGGRAPANGCLIRLGHHLDAHSTRSRHP
ncbi:histidine phosphatase family protein [Mycobacterium sp. PS03-16]|uniref:histidine phosphatase family protein n=1 Tax=Mycobacterium sp. PS03-16 TaxID=2559611 RepID=UPI0010731E38|nr:histidine phosphatase family protein [Mycobacterium sp. PS03-16]TFV54622.1 histidine phosphatase family protein [Mycobacterium sp. PS03-16]